MTPRETAEPLETEEEAEEPKEAAPEVRERDAATPELFEEYARTRDADLRERLILAHSNLARYLARKFANRGEPLEDLTQVGMIGLMNAIDRFDPTRGIRFATYATPTILGEIRRYFRDRGWAVKVPRRLQELSLAANKAVDTLTQELDRAPTVAEIAARREIGEQEKQVFMEEFEKGTGILFLHHSLASHPEWPGYMKLVGGKYHLPDYTPDSNRISDFRHDITLHVEVLDPEHPVTRGMIDFDILDEGYTNTTRLPGTHPLLQTDHPDCDRIIGWTHEVKNSKVVYLMGGHDRHAYENESFRELVRNAVIWIAK